MKVAKKKYTDFMEGAPYSLKETISVIASSRVNPVSLAKFSSSLSLGTVVEDTADAMDSNLSAVINALGVSLMTPNGSTVAPYVMYHSGSTNADLFYQQIVSFVKTIANVDDSNKLVLDSINYDHLLAELISLGTVKVSYVYLTDGSFAIIMYRNPGALLSFAEVDKLYLSLKGQLTLDEFKKLFTPEVVKKVKHDVSTVPSVASGTLQKVLPLDTNFAKVIRHVDRLNKIYMTLNAQGMIH
ncbi:hypothetical protein HWC09_gp088 [Lactobacillus phage 3-521]|uniref:Uncharacterized protein n=1 Tax=Lactobacillus phage 3-521 TaxID=2510943 RepID=A0A4Y5FEW1_9CAUD|nr:hypothetical protein HWC09_gp088 [Lactobacillus phage 3-521]QBJ03631.1 hypothetical protein UCC3521_0093 [Lactobacillus phage 3-521]